MNFLIGAIVTILIVLAFLENPYFFRYHSLRFVYRSGLLLYSRTFKIQTLTNKTSPSRGHILLWMNESGFSIPKAMEDGEKRFLLKEYLWQIGLLREIYISALMRAKIYWDNKENYVVVHGYVTWSYLLLLAVAILMLLISSNEGNILGGVLLFIYLLWCAIVYIIQVPHFHSVGKKVAKYLSSDDE